MLPLQADFNSAVAYGYQASETWHQGRRFSQLVQSAAHFPCGAHGAAMNVAFVLEAMQYASAQLTSRTH